MKFSEWLKVYSTEMSSPDFHGVSYRALEDMEEAWNMAKADCQEEIHCLETKAQRAFDDWVEEKLKAEKAMLAIAEIANIFTSETDPTRACHRIQAIVNRRGRGE